MHTYKYGLNWLWIFTMVLINRIWSFTCAAHIHVHMHRHARAAHITQKHKHSRGGQNMSLWPLRLVRFEGGSTGSAAAFLRCLTTCWIAWGGMSGLLIRSRIRSSSAECLTVRRTREKAGPDSCICDVHVYIWNTLLPMFVWLSNIHARRQLSVWCACLYVEYIVIDVMFVWLLEVH